MNPLLDICNLSISFVHKGKKTKAVHRVSFSLLNGEKVGIIGENGSGKSATTQAILKLLPSAEIQGEIFFEGEDLLKMNEKKIGLIRGKKIGISFQESGSSFNPTMTIGKQIEESLIIHNKPKEKAAFLLEMVGLPKEILKYYAHQLSGGMKQRVDLCLGLACFPKLFIADEPTTALDPKSKEQIISLLKNIPTSLILVSHDLHVISQVCDKILVFNQGVIVEEGNTFDIFHYPKHPYTKMLINA